MESITVNGYAKVNLALDILGRRPNGYHEVMMVMQQLELCDKITIRKTGAKRREIVLTTNKDGVPLDYRNLAYQAAQIMLGLYELVEGVEIHIDKNIPIEAGLAGGSTDCAATLIGMNELFDMNMSKESLCGIGARLGSDIPFCILGGTAVAGGTGAKLSLVKGFPPKKYTVVLCKPPAGISTALVYRKYSDNINLLRGKRRPDIVNLLDGLSAGVEISKLENCMVNVLEYITAEDVPQIKEIEEVMLEEGAAKAMMTGSGTAVFGIFENPENAAKAFSRLSAEYEETIITDFKGNEI